jgi:hypothetical protein
VLFEKRREIFGHRLCIAFRGAATLPKHAGGDGQHHCGEKRGHDPQLKRRDAKFPYPSTRTAPECRL